MLAVRLSDVESSASIAGVFVREKTVTGRATKSANNLCMPTGKLNRVGDAVSWMNSPGREPALHEGFREPSVFEKRVSAFVHR